MSQNGQTYFKNLEAFAARFLTFIWPFWGIMHGRVKDTHREKAPSNKAQAFAKSMNMYIWVVGKLNLIFVRGSYNEIRFSKK